MVQRRNCVAMALLTLALGCFFAATPLPLYSYTELVVGGPSNASSNQSAAGGTTATRKSVSFFETCPLNATDGDRVIATQCQVTTIERALCSGDAAVSTLGKIAAIGSISFTGFCVVAHLLSENYAQGEQQRAALRTVTVLQTVLALLFANLFWVMCVVALLAPVCDGRVAPVELPQAVVGAGLPVAAVGAFLLWVAALGVIARPEWGKIKQL